MEAKPFTTGWRENSIIHNSEQDGDFVCHTQLTLAGLFFAIERWSNKLLVDCLRLQIMYSPHCSTCRLYHSLLEYHLKHRQERS
jgi:hypothetical protein